MQIKGVEFRDDAIWDIKCEILKSFDKFEVKEYIISCSLIPNTRYGKVNDKLIKLSEDPATFSIMNKNPIILHLYLEKKGILFREESKKRICCVPLSNVIMNK